MTERHLHACDAHAPLAFARLMDKADVPAPGDRLVLDSSLVCPYCRAMRQALSLLGTLAERTADAARNDGPHASAAVRKEAESVDANLRLTFGRPWA